MLNPFWLEFSTELKNTVEEETFFQTTVLRVKQPLDDGTKTGEYKLNDYNATDVRLFGTSKTCAADLTERIRARKQNAMQPANTTGNVRR